MSLDIWFRPDVARILNTAYEAMDATASAVAGEMAPGYIQGFAACLRAISAGFGLPSPADRNRMNALAACADLDSMPRVWDVPRLPVPYRYIDGDEPGTG